MASAKSLQLRSVQRIISLPITRPRNSVNRSSLRSSSADQKGSDADNSLTYYHFQLHPTSANSQAEQSTQSKSKPVGWGDWARNKAETTWANFGKAPEGTWKLRVFRAGERFVDRIDFEELALKGVDPSLGPTILRPDITGKRREASDKTQRPIIQLLYPPSIHSSEASLAHLRSLLQAREPKHRKGFWMWMMITPLTFPLKFIPIIPNLPFFFCVWRSWSHYRAYRASQYLTTLVEQGSVVPTPSPILDSLLNKDSETKSSPSSLVLSESSSSSESSHSESSDSEPPHAEAVNEGTEMLLTRSAVPAFISAFTLKESAASDVYRAIEQARMRFGRRPRA